MMATVGQYYETSWGYDQTNYDFIIVVGLSPSGKTATCRMARPIHLGESGQTDILTPGTAYGEPFTMEVGFTPLGIQVWCKRHEVNVLHMDFEGQRHPANTHMTAPQNKN